MGYLIMELVGSVVNLTGDVDVNRGFTSRKQTQEVFSEMTNYHKSLQHLLFKEVLMQNNILQFVNK